jgi:glycosyltransferase involved in cell wall biosynthesis
MSVKRDFGSVARLDQWRSSKGMTVAVIIPTYNHARYLADAISSVVAQTRHPDEIIVVDDGSTDDPATVAARFPGVRLIRQENQGRSAARNAGLRNCKSSHVVFLDADDRLLPNALEVGLNCAAKHPDCAFVYGGHRDIIEDGVQRVGYHYSPVSGDAQLALMRRNLIRMQATAVFRRDCLMDMGGYDETLERAEDYDLFLRLARNHSIACHPTIVAEYRWHGKNTCEDAMKMLQSTLSVLDRHEARIKPNDAEREALQEGRAIWRDHYAWLLLEAGYANWPSGQSMKLLGQAIETSPLTVARTFMRFVGRRIKRAVPSGVARWINRRRGLADRIPVGAVQFGDLRRQSPISPNFGFDRGTPIDRYYLEGFLARNANDIRGRVLEAGDNTYTIRFGGSRVQTSDIIHLDATNLHATIVGDLAQPDLLPPDTFDCIVLTHALHYVFDMRMAIASQYRALKPGGVALLTMPGVSAVDDGEWGSKTAWSLTAPLARRLMEEQFDPEAITIEAYGNVFAATAFLHGLAVEEVGRSELDVHDPRYPVVVAIRAVKTPDR